MGLYLLTGAGFSKNWGGLIASEVFGHLLGSDLDQVTRDLLYENRATGGFEKVLACLVDNFERSPNITNNTRLSEFHMALYAMFEQMSHTFLEQSFEFQNDVAYQITPFLEKFDAIFTTNQDTLLEGHYTGGNLRSGGWAGLQMPGMKIFANGSPNHDAVSARLARRMPDSDYGLIRNQQPYFKLHGSINWRVNGHVGHIMIMGAEKASRIKRYPILEKYRQEFAERLAEPKSRLMIIGYGFGDSHINDLIAHGIEQGLRIFIVDPNGVDAFDSQTEPFKKLMRVGVIGESRTPLRDTFNTNYAEHRKLLRFVGPVHQ